LNAGCRRIRCLWHAWVASQHRPRRSLPVPSRFAGGADARARRRSSFSRRSGRCVARERRPRRAGLRLRNGNQL
jgi:hypothetical protein